MSPCELQQYYEHALQQPRYCEPKRLLRFGWKAYSQSDEDGIIIETFRRIGEGLRTFIEIGAGEGLENNTTALLLAGWRGLWIEGHSSSCEAIRERLFINQVSSGQLLVHNELVTRDNVDDLVNSFGPEPALLSIDVDGNDYWIWQAIESIKPRLVVIEYNATWHPPMSMTISYRESFLWDRSNYFGASLTALEQLGRRKGYSLVGCCFAGVNAFFVRNDLLGDLFLEPFTAENHYEPPRYFMVRPSGHPPGVGQVDLVARA